MRVGRHEVGEAVGDHHAHGRVQRARFLQVLHHSRIALARRARAVVPLAADGAVEGECLGGWVKDAESKENSAAGECLSLGDGNVGSK